MPPSAAPNVVDVLRALDRAGVEYVLIGELAELLHGSPLLPVTGTVTIVPRVGQRKRLGAAITAAGGKSIATPAAPAIDTSARFALEAHRRRARDRAGTGGHAGL